MGNFRGVTAAEGLPGSRKDKQRIMNRNVFKISEKADKDVFGEAPEDIPPPEPIAPAPEVDDDQARVSRSRQRKRGRQSTVLTGDLAPEQKKKTTLG
jgi:hypothetical protein